MRAIVKEHKGHEGIKIKEQPEPIPNCDEIKIKIHAGGICGTDLHIMSDEYEYTPGVIMGHEYSGTVVEVGSNVVGFKQGDRVVSLTAAYTCGTCQYCQRGLLMLCDKRLSIGSGLNGSFAEYMCIPAHLAFKLSDKISLDAATLCEPLACAVRNVIEMSNLKASDYALVSGPGTMGQLVMQIAHACGAKVMITGTNADTQRLKIAKQTGADKAVNINVDDVEKEMMTFTKGNGFDVAFECSGVAASAETCLKLLKKTGQYSQVGLFGKPISFNHDLALKKEIHMINSFASERTSWVRALRLLENKQINTEVLASRKYKFEDYQAAFDAAISKEGFKILLVP